MKRVYVCKACRSELKDDETPEQHIKSHPIHFFFEIVELEGWDKPGKELKQ